MSYLIYILFGIMPSLIWLSFYLRKDSHPESNWMILKIFLYGVIATLPAALLEFGVFGQLSKINLSEILILIIYFFLGVALIEELIKYLIVREKVLKDSELDEPTDIIIYMIIAALGFAAMENILLLFSLGDNLSSLGVSLVLSSRFLGATFLHALVSGTVGYFFALSLYETKRRNELIVLGLTIAIILHGLYNLSIIKAEGYFKIIIPAIILISLAIFVSWGFNNIKKLKSVCKITLKK